MLTAVIPWNTIYPGKPVACSPRQEIPHPLQKQNIYCRVHTNPQLILIASQLNLIHQPYLLTINFNIKFRGTPRYSVRYFSFQDPDQRMYAFFISHTCAVYLSYCFRFDNPNNIWLTLQLMFLRSNNFDINNFPVSHISG